VHLIDHGALTYWIWTPDQTNSPIPMCLH